MIVGLGNPGLRYRHTRHNIGFLAVDNFAKIKKAGVNKKGFHSLFGKIEINGEEAVLLKPQTYMNNSGAAVAEAVEKFAVGPEDILVICDDINLRLGIIRLRPKGSAGGQKGLKSIIKELNSEDFNRLRIGIGYGQGRDLTDYVLSGFRAGEKRFLKEVLGNSADAISVWLEEGIEAAMNKFNVKNNMEVI